MSYLLNIYRKYPLPLCDMLLTSIKMLFPEKEHNKYFPLRTGLSAL